MTGRMGKELCLPSLVLNTFLTLIPLQPQGQNVLRGRNWEGNPWIGM